MPIEIVIIGFLSGVVTLGFGSLALALPDHAVRYWALAWLSFLGMITLAAVSIQWPAFNEAPPILFGNYAFDTTFATLMCAGAVVFAERSLPRWFWPAAAGVVVLRGTLAVFGLQHVAHVISIVLDPGMALAGAWALFRALPQFHHRGIGAALAVGYVGLAAAEIQFSLLALTQTIRIEHTLPAGGVCLTLVTLQMLAVLSRSRGQERYAVELRQRDLELLRQVAREGGSSRDVRELVDVVLRRVQDRLTFDLLGVWLRSDDGENFDCAGALGMPDDTPAAATQIPASRADMQHIAAWTEPLISNEILAERRFAPEFEGDLPELGRGAVVPLWHDGEFIGFFFAIQRDATVFGEEDHSLLLALGDELALALHNVRANRRIAEHVRALDTQQRTLSAVLENAPVGVVVEDRDGAVAILSRTAMQHLDIPDPEGWLGHPMNALLQSLAPRLGSDGATLEKLLSIDRESLVENLTLSLSGPMERSLLVSTSPVLSPENETLGRVWITRDETDERRMEEDLRQAQKLDTVGRLAGGIAHDFNNQLTAILGNARLIQDPQLDATDRRESLQDLERAAEHCAQLTESLLAFSRRSSMTVCSIEVEPLLHEVTELMRPLLPSSIAMEVSVPENLPPIEGDPLQLKQVFINLLVNARDAIVDGGSVRILVTPREIDPRVDRPLAGVKPGPHIEFAIEDTGCGMDEATLERMFEPFFTTKGVGQGTGLGLAIVYGVIGAHRGGIEVESEPKRGTTFRLLLPVAREEQRDEAVKKPQLEVVELSGTVLLADDEPALRRFARRVLTRAGLEVVEAKDGDDAVEQFQSHARDIRLVLLDITMPGRTGYAALAAIREIAPDVPAILTSGHADHGQGEHDATFLPKPYDKRSLLASVRALLKAPEDKTET